MKQLADGVWQLAGLPAERASTSSSSTTSSSTPRPASPRARSSSELEGRPLAAHALTHAHPDHQGASHAVCERFGVPFWVGEKDVPAAENPKLIGERQPDHFMAQLFAKTMTGPAHHVDRPLREGDEVASFKVIDVPGHSAGHVAFWRESDGVLVLGDVLNSLTSTPLIPGLREPKDYFTPDPAENRRSARKLGLLEPKLVLFGHGPPVTRHEEVRRLRERPAGLAGDLSFGSLRHLALAPDRLERLAYLARIRSERGHEVLGDPAGVNRPHPLEHRLALAGDLDVERAPVARARHTFDQACLLDAVEQPAHAAVA